MHTRRGRQNLGTAVATVVLSTLMAGCGGGKADVSGKVSYKGKLLVTGTVSMVGPDGIVRQGPINRDGTFRVTGVAAGKVQIGVLSLNPAGDARRGGRPAAVSRTANATPDPARDGSAWFAIPTIYQEPTNSGLSAVLASGSNQYDIKLQ
jgi:hypothetical protein